MKKVDKNDKIKVGVVGYGTIGKRVADAVAVQEDMILVGVSDVQPTKLLSVAEQRGYPIFCPDQFEKKILDAGINLTGTIDSLLDVVDVVVDATPKGFPEKNIPIYKEKGLRFIIHGGEKHTLTGLSFSTFGNYESNLNQQGTRVVSCNTNALTRMYRAIDSAFGISYANIDLVRRGSDPVNGDKGPSNAVVPVLGESHHYGDLKTVVYDAANGSSSAVAIPHTLSHIHMINLELKKDPTVEDVVSALEGFPRIRLFEGVKDGMTDTAKIAEYYSDLGRLRGDHPELIVWREGIGLKGYRLGLKYDVHMMSIPIPETVDAIRALAGRSTMWESARMTDKALDKNLPLFSKQDDCYFPR